MSDPILVPPTLIERVAATPTSLPPAIARLAGTGVMFPFDQVPPQAMGFGATLVEAVTSSRIENIDVSVTQAALAILQPRHPAVTDAGRAVAANFHAITDALATTARYDDHRAAHTRLMKAQRTPGYAGFRETFVRVGDHVAPAPQRVRELMEDLAAFASFRPSTVVNAAIAHAQFETIHPYADGNGRIGRALLVGALRAPVSPWLLMERSSYYDALRGYRLGDASPIVNLLAAAAGHGFDINEETDDSQPDLDRLSDEALDVVARLHERPVGTRHRMVPAGSKRLNDGFSELIAREQVMAVSDDRGLDTVYAYLPVVLTWHRLAPTGRVQTHYEGKWKGDIRV